MSIYVKENITKNLIILMISVFMYPVLSDTLSQIKFEQTNDFLLTISTLLVTVCFANFGFTYEKSRLKTFVERMLSHSATGIFMLLTALLLESIVILIKNVYPFFHSLVFEFLKVHYLFFSIRFFNLPVNGF